jgi:hypothetical protein
MAKKA